MNTHRRTPRPARRARSLRFGIALAVFLALAGVAFAGISRATDQPAFCGSACHEMSPYHDAWAAGPHSGVSCVECHVDSGTIPRMQHKVVALKEVASHVTGAPTFPLAQPASVPDERCVRCHANVTVNLTGFSHADHAARGACVACHATAGHSVSVVALKAAGIYGVQAGRAAETTKAAVVDGGKANLRGHVAVPCSRCHDLAATGCATCHARPAGHQSGACSSCHSTGAKWAFKHPSGSDCASCHQPPAPHFSAACSSCHSPSRPWASAMFLHPGIPGGQHSYRSFTCTKCHSTGRGPAYFCSCHGNTTGPSGD